jgi:Tfp pilus assembly protein PilX
MSRNGKRLNQSGMVSFMVTLVMMAVITLIVVGFSQVTHRNQREALDRQLSTQAFYAAESGVNVTKAAIQTYTGTTLPKKSSCSHEYDPTNSSGGTGASIGDISTPDNVRYTCVLVDPNPSSLIYDKLKQGNSIVVPMTTSAAISSLSFNWTRQTGMAGNCGAQARSYLPPAANWNCPFALLRVDIMQVPNPAASISNVSQLTSNTASLFLTPYGDNSGTLYNNVSGANGASLAFGGSPTVYYGAAKASTGAAGGCATSSSSNCLMNVSLANTSLSTYYARITPLYHDVDELVITAKAGALPVTFNGTQAIVDVTGQAQDELRRIQVRVGLQGGDDVPANAVASSNDICKNFTILPSQTIGPVGGAADVPNCK